MNDSQAPPPSPPFDVVLRAGGVRGGYWGDLWRYRELFMFLAWRDIKVRYKQMTLGIAWAVIRPLLIMAVFTILFSRVAHLPSPDGVPYALLVLAGMLPWQFFAAAMSDAANSLFANSALITKVYFPRLIVPAGVVVVAFVDLLIAAGLMAAVMAWYSYPPPVQVFTAPLFLALALVAALGVGLWLSALAVKYRDFRFIVPFLAQFGLYVTPVGFSTDVIPEPWRAWYALNPMVGVIEGLRWAVLGTPVRWLEVAISAGTSALLAFSGFWYFRRTERAIADTL